MDQNQQNQYNFIENSTSNLSPEVKPTNDKKHRIIIAIVFALILIIITIVLLLLFSAAKNKDKVNLIKVAASQQEIIDISKNGQNDIRDPKLQQLSANTYVVVQSQNQSLQTYMNKVGLKKFAKDIATIQDVKYKESLKDAKAQGTYDTKFTEILSQRIDKYKVNLKSAYSAASSNSLKKQLSDDYSAVETLFPSTSQK